MDDAAGGPGSVVIESDAAVRLALVHQGPGILVGAAIATAGGIFTIAAVGCILYFVATLFLWPREWIRFGEHEVTAGGARRRDRVAYADIVGWRWDQGGAAFTRWMRSGGLVVETADRRLRTVGRIRIPLGKRRESARMAVERLMELKVGADARLAAHITT